MWILDKVLKKYIVTIHDEMTVIQVQSPLEDHMRIQVVLYSVGLGVQTQGFVHAMLGGCLALVQACVPGLFEQIFLAQ